jgi:hypothetical protein
MDKKEMRIGELKPLYSDAAMVSYTTTWKADKSGKKAEKKEHMVKIFFGDSTTNVPVVYLVMNTINARNLVSAIQNQLNSIEKDSKSSRIPGKAKPVESSSGSYIG